MAAKKNGSSSFASIANWKVTPALDDDKKLTVTAYHRRGNKPTPIPPCLASFVCPGYYEGRMNGKGTFSNALYTKLKFDIDKSSISTQIGINGFRALFGDTLLVFSFEMRAQNKEYEVQEIEDICKIVGIPAPKTK